MYCRSLPCPRWKARACHNRTLNQLTRILTAFVSRFCLGLLELSPSSCCPEGTGDWAEVDLTKGLGKAQANTERSGTSHLTEERRERPKEAKQTQGQDSGATRSRS